MSPKFDLNLTLQKNILLLKYIGLWPASDVYFEKTKYTFYSITVILVFLFTDNFSMFINISVSISEIEKLSIILAIFSEKFMAVIKLIFFLRNIKTVKLLMRQLSSDIFKSRNEGQFILMKHSMAVYVKVFKFFLIMCTVTVMMFCLSPILMKQKRMPFENWYPYDHNISPWFEITFLYQCVSTLVNSCTNVGIDSFSAGVMAVLGCQCELLEYKLFTFNQQYTEEKENSESNNHHENLELVNECNAFIFDIVEHHRQILLDIDGTWFLCVFSTEERFYFQQDGADPHNAASNVNNFGNQWIGTNGTVKLPACLPDLTSASIRIFCYALSSFQPKYDIMILQRELIPYFSITFFGQMALCLMLFCTAMYRLSVMDSINSDLFALLAFILTISIQLFLYCWFGNEVYYKSSRLYLAAYQCDWVGYPINFQKNLIIFMQKTRDPIIIYALSFFPLVITTFRSVMRSSWSFFLLLRQLNK